MTRNNRVAASRNGMSLLCGGIENGERNRGARIIELKADIVVLETLDDLQTPRVNLLLAFRKLAAARTIYGIESFDEMSFGPEACARLIDDPGKRSATETLVCFFRKKINLPEPPRHIKQKKTRFEIVRYIYKNLTRLFVKISSGKLHNSAEKR